MIDYQTSFCFGGKRFLLNRKVRLLNKNAPQGGALTRIVFASKLAAFGDRVSQAKLYLIL
ncbi:MAG TPA: hypothetical protein VJ888_09730 [Mobilitalea sp.]|nr:hypothetical protein [Mobilitalea sp.]